MLIMKLILYICIIIIICLKFLLEILSILFDVFWFCVDKYICIFYFYVDRLVIDMYFS